jgi:hypothetical protein
MIKAGFAILLNATLLAAIAPAPLSARVEGYGPMRYTQVGPRNRNWERGHGRGDVIDRRRGDWGGNNWGGAIAGGILGAVAGLALGNGYAPPVVAGPPPVGTIVGALPPGCGSVPTYNGSVLYNCGGIFYQPIYQGAALMFEVVPGP